jgi:hypothetical protein
MLKIMSNVLTDIMKWAHRFFKGDFLKLHSVFVLIQLFQKVSHVIKLLLLYALVHLLENWSVFLGQGALIEG